MMFSRWKLLFDFSGTAKISNKWLTLPSLLLTSSCFMFLSLERCSRPLQRTNGSDGSPPQLNTLSIVLKIQFKGHNKITSAALVWH